MDVEIVGSDNYENDIKEIIKQSQLTAYRAVNVLLVKRNWLIGKRIYEEVLKGDNRAVYGTMIITKLSKTLTKEFGKGYGKTNLYSFYTFYKLYRNIFQSVIGKSQILNWTHYYLLIQIFDSKAREWYEKECFNQQRHEVRNSSMQPRFKKKYNDFLYIETFSTHRVENLYYQLGQITLFLFLSLTKDKKLI